MKGLILKGAATTTGRARENVQAALDILEEIQQRVIAMGVTDFPKPEGELQSLATTNVGALTNRELETHYAGYVAYCSYLGPKVAEAITSHRIATANLKRIAANIKMGLLRDKTPRSELQTRTLDSEEYVEYELEQLKLAAVKEILQAHFDAYQAQAAALSRIVEIRKLEFEDERRQGNFARNPKHPGRGPMPGVRRP